jgi:hypothetical protein
MNERLDLPRRTNGRGAETVVSYNEKARVRQDEKEREHDCYTSP